MSGPIRFPASGGGSLTNVNPNLLLNSSFGQNERVNTPTNENDADGGQWWTDRWYTQNDAGVGNCTTITQTEAHNAGYAGAYRGDGYVRIVARRSGSTIGWLILQPIEQKATIGTRGQTMRLSLKVGANAGSSTRTVKFGVWAWTGTADSPSNLVSSWSSNVPTFKTTTLTKLGEGSQTIGMANTFYETGVTCGTAVPDDANNLYAAIWCEDGTLSDGQTVEIADVDLHVGDEARDYQRQHASPGAEARECKRFFRANSNKTPTTSQYMGVSGRFNSTTQGIFEYDFSDNPMRGTPSFSHSGNMASNGGPTKTSGTVTSITLLSGNSDGEGGLLDVAFPAAASATESDSAILVAQSGSAARLEWDSELI